MASIIQINNQLPVAEILQNPQDYKSATMLRLLTPYQIHKELLINENFLVVDAFLNGGVISRGVSDLPSEGVDFGAKYIVPRRSNSTGLDQIFKSEDLGDCQEISDKNIAKKNEDNQDDISENDGVNIYLADEIKVPKSLEKVDMIIRKYSDHIALYLGDWFFIKPKVGCMQWIAEEEMMVVYAGESGWKEVAFIKE